MARMFRGRKAAFFPPPAETTVRFGRLSGGLNLRELEYRMDGDQSPELKNLWWHDGLLGCRDGQEYLSDQSLDRGFACYDKLYWGRAVAHIGDGLYAGIPKPGMQLEKLCSGLPAVRGTFVTYQEALFYKTRGAFKKITWDGSGLCAEDVAPYVPITVINCSPQGAGDLYQPENRLSAEKTVWYTVQQETRSIAFDGDPLLKEFHITTDDGEPVAAVKQVYIDTTLLAKTEYTMSADNRTVTLRRAASSDTVVSVVYTVGIRTYRLPVQQVDAVTGVTLDGEPITDYTADLKTGVVTFQTAPPMQDPPVNNTLHITYEKCSPDAFQSVDDCTYAAVYGGTGGAALILAGSQKQPNAYFWNGSHLRMDPGYFPVDCYNLAGDNLEAVTGFGEQAGFLIIFKEHSVGRCTLGTKMILDRAYLSLDYTPVNGVIGCDLPWTIRLVDNNLVWCSTDKGVCCLSDTTEALENQVLCLSGRINGGSRPGLLEAVRTAETVCALEDGQRYWVCADGAVFLWDHSLSSAGEPSWFYLTNIDAQAFFRGDSLPGDAMDGPPFTGSRRLYHLDREGRISCFVRNFRDYGGPIEKVCRFPAQIFGTYDRLKNVRRLVLAAASDTDTTIRLEYLTDYGVREDPAPVICKRRGQLPRTAHIAARKPACRHVRHFGLRLSNNTAGCDMAIVSAEITAQMAERER